MKSYQESRRINTILVYAMLGAGAVLMIFPFLWMLLTSFKSAGESVQISCQRNGLQTITRRH